MERSVEYQGSRIFLRKRQQEGVAYDIDRGLGCQVFPRRSLSGWMFLSILNRMNLAVTIHIETVDGPR